MKKYFSKSLMLISIFLLTMCVFVSCNKNSSETSNMPTNAQAKTASSETKPKVTLTTPFLYDMANEIAKDMFEFDMIIPVGSDPHVYVAKPEDYTKINEANLVLYHGLHFEGKMTEALEEKGVSLSYNFPQEKLIQMTEDGEEIVDPHFWFDIDLYKLAMENMSNELIKILPDKEKDIKMNLENYFMKLDAVKEDGIKKISSIPKENRFLITPHDAFNYFSRTFDIEVVAPQGVSTDAEVSNKDLSETVDFIVNNSVKAIFAESTTDPARMEKLKESCKEKGFEVKVVSGEGNELFSDSLAPEGQEGDKFITMLEHNINLIYENLK